MRLSKIVFFETYAVFDSIKFVWNILNVRGKFLNVYAYINMFVFDNYKKLPRNSYDMQQNKIVYKSISNIFNIFVEFRTLTFTGCKIMIYLWRATVCYITFCYLQNMELSCRIY